MRNKQIIRIALFAILLFSCKPASQQAEAPENDKEEIVANNKKISDFSMNAPDGKAISVLDEIKTHKITIIDFWASWCGPCFREAPNLVDLYKKYNEKGLGIIGVSLDSEETNWKNAIEQWGLSWTHVSDLQGWNNAAAIAHNVRAIPFTMIVDQEGNILKEGLTGENLRDFIESQFKEEK